MHRTGECWNAEISNGAGKNLRWRLLLSLPSPPPREERGDLYGRRFGAYTQVTPNGVLGMAVVGQMRRRAGDCAPYLD